MASVLREHGHDEDDEDHHDEHDDHHDEDEWEEVEDRREIEIRELELNWSVLSMSMRYREWSGTMSVEHGA